MLCFPPPIMYVYWGQQHNGNHQGFKPLFLLAWRKCVTCVWMTISVVSMYAHSQHNEVTGHDERSCVSHTETMK